MTFKHGKNCEIVIDSDDLTELFRAANTNVTVSTSDSTTFRKNWSTFVPGTASGNVSLDGLYDNDQAEAIAERLGVEAPFLAMVGPAGLAPGDLARFGRVISTSYAETAGIGDLVLMNTGLNFADRLNFGWSLSAPTTLYTEDTDGAAVDMAAAVTGANWAAQIHVLSLDDTGVDISLEHSVNGTTGWDVLDTGLSFAAPGSGIVSSTEDVRRYVRAVITFDSGTGVNSNIAVGFARVAA